MRGSNTLIIRFNLAGVEESFRDFYLFIGQSNYVVNGKNLNNFWLITETNGQLANKNIYLLYVYVYEKIKFTNFREQNKLLMHFAPQENGTSILILLFI